jgi:FkbM family methyltransferase
MSKLLGLLGCHAQDSEVCAMVHWLGRGIRTLQSAVPMAKPLKDATYLHLRRMFKIPHEYQYAIIKSYPKVFSVFVDIGANQGQTIETILLYDSKAKITSFEPHPVLAEVLTNRYADQPNIRIIPAGLGDAAGSYELHIPTYNGFVYDGAASLDYEAAHWPNKDLIFGYDEAKLAISSLICEIVTLDDFNLKPDFIKFDVQGWEYRALLGARSTIAKHEPLILIEAPCERSMNLLNEWEYKEYGFVDGRLRPGRVCNRHANCIFLTPSRCRMLDMSSTKS